MSSGIASVKYCPLLTIIVPTGLRRIGARFTIGGDGVKLGEGGVCEGVKLGLDKGVVEGVKL